MANKTATLLIVKKGNTLSSQLLKRTGDSYNSVSFNIYEKGDFIRHKETGKQFIVMSHSQYKNLSKPYLAKVLSYYKAKYGLKTIRKK